MAEIKWNRKAAAEYIIENGSCFARVKNPRGLASTLRRVFGRQLLGKCFQNSLYLALRSQGKLLYCEGFAQGEYGWYPHAWVTPTRYMKDENDIPYWAIDVTWPWTHKGQVFDHLEYVGISLPATTAYEFLNAVNYNMDHTDRASISVLKYVHLLPQFLSGMG